LYRVYRQNILDDWSQFVSFLDALRSRTPGVFEGVGQPVRIGVGIRVHVRAPVCVDFSVFNQHWTARLGPISSFHGQATPTRLNPAGYMAIRTACQYLLTADIDGRPLLSQQRKYSVRPAEAKEVDAPKASPTIMKR